MRANGWPSCSIKTCPFQFRNALFGSGSIEDDRFHQKFDEMSYPCLQYPPSLSHYQMEEEFGMELILAHQTDQHDTKISVTCDGKFSHTFDLLALLPNDDKSIHALDGNPVAYGNAIYVALFPSGTPAQQALSKAPERVLLVLADEDLDAIGWEYAYGPTGFLVLEHHVVRSLSADDCIDLPMLSNRLHIVAVPSIRWMRMSI